MCVVVVIIISIGETKQHARGACFAIHNRWRSAPRLGAAIIINDNMLRPARVRAKPIVRTLDACTQAHGNYTFGYGGFQGARGENTGGDFFIENVFEELDNPGEFFHDEATGNLYVLLLAPHAQNNNNNNNNNTLAR